jgi:IPT/TIG domain
VLATTAVFSNNFPLGTTRLLLEVKDSTCDVDSAETTVTVTGAVSPGAYCYYYNTTVLPAAGGLQADTIKPTYAFERVDAFSGSLPSAPASFAGGIFAARCFLLFQVDADSEATTVGISTDNTGSAMVYMGTKLVVDTASSSSALTAMATGLAKFEVLYLRTSTATGATLTMLVNGTSVPLSKISYDRSLVLPVLTTITPPESAVGGGVSVTVNGYGFYDPPFVAFGAAAPVRAAEAGLLPTQFTVVAPAAANGAGTVQVTASSSAGGLKSNAIDFQYGTNVADPILFTREVVKDAPGGPNTNNEVATSIAVWGGAWYSA